MIARYWLCPLMNRYGIEELYQSVGADTFQQIRIKNVKGGVNGSAALISFCL